MAKLYIHPVSKGQEANKAGDGPHSFHDQDCYVDAHLSRLHNQQALLQRLLLPNSLQREKEVRCLQASGDDTQFKHVRSRVQDDLQRCSTSSQLCTTSPAGSRTHFKVN